MIRKPNIFDIECFINYFLVVFFDIESKEYYHFEISDYKNELKELKEYCSTVSWYIGYNNGEYDCPLLEYVLTGGREIYKRSCDIIDNKRKGKSILSYVDLMYVNHYNLGPKSTSLKKLAFNFRCKDVFDMPIKHNKVVLKSNIASIIKYCINDVKVTYELYKLSMEKMRTRKELGSLFDVTLRNLPEPSMCETVFCRKLNINKYELINQYIEYPEIRLKDIIFPNVGNGITTDVAREFFESIVLRPNKSGYKFKDEKYFKLHEHNNTLTKWALGGVHGVIKKGIYTSNEDFIIKTFDAASQYPSIILNNNLYPKLLGPRFLELYQWLYNERFKYPKKTPLNIGFKLLLNIVFGKANNEYSIFRDPKFLYTITINGQLMITWLCDLLLEIPDSQILIQNTDGCEIRFPRIYEDQYYAICSKWEQIARFKLEHDNYSKIYVHNVNNYVTQFEDGRIKRKGIFSTYQDIVEMNDYHKDSSMNIIALALNEYYLNDKDPEEFIRNHTDVFDFFGGVAKKKAPKKGDFEFLMSKEDVITRFSKNDSRFLRYYASNNGVTLSKLYETRDIESVHSDTKVTLAEKLRSTDIKKFDINYKWYIQMVSDVITKSTKNS